MSFIRYKSFQILLVNALGWYLPFFLISGLSSSPVRAQSLLAQETTPESTPAEQPAASAAPQELVTMLQLMDQAANEQHLKTFIKNFDLTYIHADGLNRKQLQQTIRSFWDQYDQLSYATKLEKWESLGAGLYRTETVTTVTGTHMANTPQSKSLTATIRSEQEIKDSKIIRQKTLEEKSQVVSGSNPPSVRINLPKTVQVGQDYFLDVIVEEPLGDRILLGAAIEEPVSAQNHLTPATFEIQSLSTGGLFKIGQAPKTPADQWISAIVIQEGGILLLSQRLSVVDTTPTAYIPRPALNY